MSNLNNFHFTGLGGTDEVGASSYLYELADTRLLIDAGLRPGALGEAALPQLDLLRERPPHAMMLTHAHLDHVGALPLVTREFKDMPVYCTPATARLTALTLIDTLKISRAQGSQMFSEKDIQRTLQRLKPLGTFEQVTEAGLRFTFQPAGHLLGAVSVLLESSAGTVMHTGDISNVATPMTGALWRPHAPLNADAVVSESTYGNVTLPSRKDQVRTFISSLNAVIQRGGKVLIPSFALGRAQEIVFILTTAMESGILPRTPIYLDGMVRTITEQYEDMVDLLPKAVRNRARAGRHAPLIHGDVHLVADAHERRSVIERSGSVIVIASSGMLHAGTSPIYAREWLPEADNALFIVGYQDAEAPGRRLLELENGGEVPLPAEFGEGTQMVSAYCHIERFYLSAHADRGGLISNIKAYDPGKVILTHGEAAARYGLRDDLGGKFEVATPKAGERVSLRDSGKRKKSFMAQGFRARHRKVKVEANYDPEHGVFIIQLPDDFDPELLPSGTYSLEVSRQYGSKVKLKEQRGGEGSGEAEG